MILLTWRSARRRGPSALIGRIHVQNLNVPRRPIIDEEIVGSAQLDEDGIGTGCLSGGLLLLHRGIGAGTVFCSYG